MFPQCIVLAEPGQGPGVSQESTYQVSSHCICSRASLQGKFYGKWTEKMRAMMTPSRVKGRCAHRIGRQNLCRVKSSQAYRPVEMIRVPESQGSSCDRATGWTVLMASCTSSWEVGFLELVPKNADTMTTVTTMSNKRPLSLTQDSVSPVSAFIKLWQAHLEAHFA